MISRWKGIVEEINFGGNIEGTFMFIPIFPKTSFRASKWPRKLKTAKNSKIPKFLENCFEPVGKGGWPPISIWINYNILFGHSYMYSMKEITSSMFRMMMFPHNGKIVTIDQITHYEPNHSANIDNILPLVHNSLYDYSLIDMGPIIFKDPSFLGAYHGAPRLIHPSTQVCVISSNGTDTGDTIPPTEASPQLEVPPVEEILP
jgi:hypothetical protein